jgi:hypothetical protein
MFTPTLSKILLLVLVIGAVWWWFRRSQIKAREKAELERSTRDREKGKPAKPIEDMAQCKVCGAYVPATGARNCGRESCPY